METKIKKEFDTVEYFRTIKQKLSAKLSIMTLHEQKEFLKSIRDGKIKLT